MKLLYVVGPGWTDKYLISGRLFGLPKGTTVDTCNHAARPGLELWRRRPDLVWVFSDHGQEDKTERWLDAAAAREIPGVMIKSDGTETKYGW